MELPSGLLGSQGWVSALGKNNLLSPQSMSEQRPSAQGLKLHVIWDSFCKGKVMLSVCAALPMVRIRAFPSVIWVLFK